MPEDTKVQTRRQRLNQWAKTRPWIGWYIALVVTANFIWSIYAY